jgi:PAS domain-containing protein
MWVKKWHSLEEGRRLVPDLMLTRQQLPAMRPRSVDPMTHFEKDAQASTVALLDRFYGVFLVICIVFLTVGVPFVFHRKVASAAGAVAMAVAVLLSWRMSRRGQPQQSLKRFSVGLWLLLVGLIYGGLPPVTAGTAVAMAMMLAVVVNVRSGVIFGVSYLLAWLLYIALQAAHLAPEPYFAGSIMTGWLIGAVAIWLVLLPVPELIRSLHKAASLQRAVIEATTDGILVVNNEGKVETYNQRFMDLWQIPPESINARNDSELLNFVMQQMVDPDLFMQKVQELYAHPELPSLDTLVFKDGRRFERHSHPQRLDGKVVGRVWSFRDVTERDKAQAEIHRLAFHDALTLLPNRRLLDDRLEQAMAACRRSGQKGALLFLDLDNFKTLNDARGHGVGDTLLVEVARRISSCVRQIDTVA